LFSFGWCRLQLFSNGPLRLFGRVSPLSRQGSLFFELLMQRRVGMFAKGENVQHRSPASIDLNSQVITEAMQGRSKVGCLIE
jgi:hypothetical protein